MPLDSVTTIAFLVYSKVYHKNITYFHSKYWAFSALSHNNCDKRQLPPAKLFTLPYPGKEKLHSHWRDLRGN